MDENLKEYSPHRPIDGARVGLRDAQFLGKSMKITYVLKKRFGKKYRRLTPIELERLNMFPDNHTIGASNIKRAFFMGNALVVGVVQKLSKSLLKSLN